MNVDDYRIEYRPSERFRWWIVQRGRSVTCCSTVWGARRELRRIRKNFRRVEELNQ